MLIILGLSFQCNYFDVWMLSDRLILLLFNTLPLPGSDQGFYHVLLFSIILFIIFFGGKKKAHVYKVVLTDYFVSI